MARVGHERTAELELAPLASGERARLPVGQIADAKLFHDFRRAPLRLRHGQAVEKPHQHQVVAAAQALLYRRLLEDDPHGAPDRVPVGDDVQAQHPGRARRGRAQRRKDREERRLAGPVRTQECEHFAPPDRQVDALQGLHLAIILHHGADLDGGSGVRGICWGSEHAQLVKGTAAPFAIRLLLKSRVAMERRVRLVPVDPMRSTLYLIFLGVVLLTLAIVVRSGMLMSKHPGDPITAAMRASMAENTLPSSTTADANEIRKDYPTAYSEPSGLDVS